MFRNAQEQAVVRAAKAWGFLQPEGVEQVAAYRRGFGGEEPWADAAVRAGVLSRENQRALDQALAAASFGCSRCAVELQFAQLIALPQLVCAGCGGGLDPRGLPPEPPRPKRAEGTSSLGSIETHSGNTIGPYTVLEEIGRGSMGVVYLAQRAGLERKFALKVLNAKYLDEEAIARFRLEAQVASKLEDPGVVGVFDIGRDGARYYYAMEHCVGETLADRIKTRGRIEPTEIARLLEQVARTAHYAHERGVIHRDLKPANVIIDQSERPRITDFGLARDWSLAKGLTRSGEVLGTPYYMAPEQVRGNEIDRRIDVYAMGVMLYESLTGRRPFEGRDATELFHKIQSDRPPSVRSLNPDVPEGLATIVKVAMSRKRADRYLTAEAMAEDLASFARGEEPSHASGITAGKSRDPGKAAVWLTAGVCIGLFALIGWQMWSDRTPTQVSEASQTPSPAPESDLDRALSKARALGSERADVDRIRAEYEKVIGAAVGDDRISATLALADFLLRRGRWKDARDVVRDHVGAQSSTGLEALRIRAESLNAEGRRKQAAAVYGELAAADPKGVRGLTAAAARWRIENRRAPEAFQAARSAVALDRTYLPAVVEFVFHTLTAGDPKEANELLRGALAAAPDHPRLLFMDGLRNVIAKQVEVGLKQIDEAIALTEPSPESALLLLKGVTLTQLNRFPEAIRAFDRAQERLPTVEGHIRRGRAYWRWAKKDWTDRRLQARALEDWRAARKLDPQGFEAMVKHYSPQLQSEMRGASRPGGNTGQVGVVSSALRRRLESRAASAKKPARQLLRDALLRAASGDAWKSVSPLFARARKAAPRCRVVAEEVARVLIERDAYSEAFRAIERARDLGTPSEILDLWTGEVWWRLGKRHKAAPIYERLAAKDPRGLLGLSARAQFYMAHEDEEKAQAAVDRALKLDPNHVPSLMLKAILTVAKSPRLITEAHDLTTKAIALVGSSDGRLVLLRIQCMEISAIFDLQRGRPRRRLGPRHVKPIFEAYEHAFDLVAGPTAHLNAVSFALMIPGKHPWAAKVEGWLQEAIRRQPERGGTYVQLGRHHLVNGGPREKILEAWRKAVQVEPRILFPPFYMAIYRKRFKGPTPELDEFKDRLGKDR